MAQELPKDQESKRLPAVVPAPAPPAEAPKTRKSFAQARRVLTDDELSTPAVRAMLLDELDRLESEKGELLPYRDKFHDVDKNCAVLKEREKGGLATDIVFTSSMTIGGVVLGALPAVWPMGLGYFAMAATIGVFLIGAGVAAKVVKR